jgi:hypothetical protein
LNSGYPTSRSSWYAKRGRNCFERHCRANLLAGLDVGNEALPEARSLAKPLFASVRAICGWHGQDSRPLDRPPKQKSGAQRLRRARSWRRSHRRCVPSLRPRPPRRRLMNLRGQCCFISRPWRSDGNRTRAMQPGKVFDVSPLVLLFQRLIPSISPSLHLKIARDPLGTSCGYRAQHAEGFERDVRSMARRSSTLSPEASGPTSPRDAGGASTLEYFRGPHVRVGTFLTAPLAN